MNAIFEIATLTAVFLVFLASAKILLTARQKDVVANKMEMTDLILDRINPVKIYHKAFSGVGAILLMGSLSIFLCLVGLRVYTEHTPEIWPDLSVFMRTAIVIWPMTVLVVSLMLAKVFGQKYIAWLFRTDSALLIVLKYVGCAFGTTIVAFAAYVLANYLSIFMHLIVRGDLFSSIKEIECFVHLLCFPTYTLTVLAIGFGGLFFWPFILWFLIKRICKVVLRFTQPEHGQES